jgi:hypothetical protein
MTMLTPTMHEFAYQDAIEPHLQAALGRSGAETDFFIDRGTGDNASDFFVRTLSRQDAFVIEVKKTREDVNSRVFWNQARRYAMDSQNWVSDRPRIFSITNGEVLNVFCTRPAYPQIGYCLLQNGRYDLGSFGRDGAADEVLQQLEDRYSELFLKYLVNREEVRYDDYWLPVQDSFAAQVTGAIAGGIAEPAGSIAGYGAGSPDSESMISDAVFKALAYEILRTLLALVPRPQLHGITLEPLSTAICSGVLDPVALAGLYNDILGIDFSSLFGGATSGSDLVRLQCAIEGMPHFVRQLQNIAPARSQLSDTDFLISSIIDAVLPIDLRHRIGLAIEDNVLANSLAKLCIQSASDRVMDIAAGTGSLLTSSYDRLKTLAHNAQIDSGHAAIVACLHGIEKDPFVASMGTLRMILKDTVATTEPFIKVSDAFRIEPTASNDVLICNPPYRRSTELKATDKKHMHGRLQGAYGGLQDVSRFPFPSGQADLYMYFVEWGMLFLHPGGRAGWILSDKLLSTSSAEGLRLFLLKYCMLDAVIRYSGNHFDDFTVTTLIVLLRRLEPDQEPQVHDVKFLRIREETDIESIPEWLSGSQSISNGNGTLAVIPSNQIDVKRNWRQYCMMTPTGYSGWLAHGTMVALEDAFGKNRCRRGADNGCKALFFPYTNVPMKKAEGEETGDFHTRRTSHGQELEDWLGEIVRLGFLKTGLNSSRDVPSYYLQTSTRKSDLVLVVPPGTDVERIPSLSGLIRLAGSTYLDSHGKRRSNLDGKLVSVTARPTVSKLGRQWYYFYSASSMCTNGLAFPRMAREYFKILIPRVPCIFSTNFFVFDAPPETGTGIPEVEFSECIAAFLMSSLGQLQCELRGDGREGLLKLERKAMFGVRVLDPRRLTYEQHGELVGAFRALPSRLNGLEPPGSNNPRFGLDKVVLRILTGQDNDDSVIELERALKEDVKDRNG